jgi:teichuronic acid biosynthesis glycosyltransferase TuaC
VLAVSEHLRDKVIGLGVSPERAHLWRQGVDRQTFYPGDKAKAREALGLTGEGPVLLWVGRMVPVKGLDVLLEACRRLVKTSVPFRLYLVGDGPSRPALEAEARRAGLAERVVFAGPCPHERLGDWYRAADLTVLPSRSEGLPNVLRESAACGTPFVASRVGGVAEIADDSLDELVPPECPGALAGAIGRTLATPRRQRSARIESWDEAADRLVEALRAPRGTSPSDRSAPCVAGADR